jgi:carbon storage regulator
MLVLTRKTGEALRIGDDVVVEILEVHGERVRVGITAPREIPIVRPEAKKQAQPRTQLQEQPA